MATTTFFCHENTPILLETGEVLVLKRGQYIAVNRVTTQISKYVKSRVLECRDVPNNAIVILSFGKELGQE